MWRFRARYQIESQKKGQKKRRQPPTCWQLNGLACVHPSAGNWLRAGTAKKKTTKNKRATQSSYKPKQLQAPVNKKKREPKQIWSGGKLYVGSHFTDKSSGNGLDSFIGNRVRSLTFFLVWLRFTGFFWVFLGFPGFSWVFLGFPGFYWVFWVLLGFIGCYWVYCRMEPVQTGFQAGIGSFM